MILKKVFLVSSIFLFLFSFVNAEVYVITKEPLEEVFNKTSIIEFDGNYRPYEKKVIETTIYDYKAPIDSNQINYVSCFKDDGFLVCIGEKLYLKNMFRD